MNDAATRALESPVLMIALLSMLLCSFLQFTQKGYLAEGKRWS